MDREVFETLLEKFFTFDHFIPKDFPSCFFLIWSSQFLFLRELVFGLSPLAEGSFFPLEHFFPSPPPTLELDWRELVFSPFSRDLLRSRGSRIFPSHQIRGRLFSLGPLSFLLTIHSESKSRPGPLPTGEAFFPGNAGFSFVVMACPLLHSLFSSYFPVSDRNFFFNPHRRLLLNDIATSYTLALFRPRLDPQPFLPSLLRISLKKSCSNLTPRKP